jgi:hypothetical protein
VSAIRERGASATDAEEQEDAAKTEHDGWRSHSSVGSRLFPSFFWMLGLHPCLSLRAKANRGMGAAGGGVPRVLTTTILFSSNGKRVQVAVRARKLGRRKPVEHAPVEPGDNGDVGRGASIEKGTHRKSHALSAHNADLLSVFPSLLTEKGKPRRTLLHSGAHAHRKIYRAGGAGVFAGASDPVVEPTEPEPVVDDPEPVVAVPDPVVLLAAGELSLLAVLVPLPL